MRRVQVSLLTGAALAAGLAHAQPAASPPASNPASVAPEVSDVATLPSAGPHRLWLINGFGGGGAQVLDGDTGKTLGTINGADLSTYAADKGQRLVYVAESIWSRGNRGQRQDILSVYDGLSLKLQAEIPLPSRAYVAAGHALFALSPDGARGYVYAMQPATSVVVVDLAGRKVARTVDTPGCALIFPWGADGFSSLCGDGSLATVTTGAKPALTRSQPFFDAEHDPVFETSPADAAGGPSLFVTYSGMVHPVVLGPTPQFAPAWSLQAAAGLPPASLETGSLAWRPGGRAPMDLHRASGRLYVLMHPGEPWTHGKAGTELWIVDTKAQKVLRRIELETPVRAVAVSQDDHPLLYLEDMKNSLSIRDADTFDEKKSVDFGDFGGATPMVPGA
jgi:methylamine dehydrogenase heavy chain